MTLRPQFSLINSEFNDFLYASVGEDKHGISLTVLSALTRLGFDPWGEAARLSDLPKEIAARALATTIAVLPARDWKASDAAAIAGRLIDRLPPRNKPDSEPAEDGRSNEKKTKPDDGKIWMVAVILAGAVLFAVFQVATNDHSGSQPTAISMPDG